MISVIGIDPGSRNTGWGIVHEASGVLRLVCCGVIQPSCNGSFAERLAHIFQEISSIIIKYKPVEASVEQVFTAQNPLTALKLGQARGAAVVACANQGLLIKDYEATTIKKTLVGHGRATKEQVSFMVGRSLGVNPDWPIDTSDALATAICHLTIRRFENRTVRVSKRL